MTSAAPSSGSLERMLARAVEPAADADGVENTASTALIIPGAPSVVTLVGSRRPACDHVSEEAGPGGLGLLVAHREVEQVFPALGVDAPGHEEGLFGPLAPQRLEDGVAKEVLDADVGEVSGAEGLVVLPELVGDLGDRGLGDEQLAGRVTEGVLHVARGQPSGVHLGHQAFEDVGVALEERHQVGAVGLAGVAHLGDADVDGAFGGADAPGLIAVARPALVPPRRS